MFFCTEDDNNIATQVKRTTSERKYLSENVRLSLASYHAIQLSTPQTIHFRFNRKLKYHGVASTLHVFEPLEPRLQHPRLRSTTNFVYRRNDIVPFISRSITLICHEAAGHN